MLAIAATIAAVGLADGLAKVQAGERAKVCYLVSRRPIVVAPCACTYINASFDCSLHKRNWQPLASCRLGLWTVGRRCVQRHVRHSQVLA